MKILNSQAILQQKRWVWIDSDKGISIILVAFGHCLMTLTGHGLALDSYPIFTYINVFLFGFRMPLFFIISGIFIGSGLKRKGLKEYITNRADIVLFPLLVWGIIEISLQLLTEKYTHNGIGPITYLYLIIDPRKTSHFWYLHALFSIGVMYAVLRSKFKIKPAIQLFIGLFLYLISAYIHTHTINGYFFTDICEFYFFFALGDFISNVVLLEKNSKRIASFTLFVPLLIVFSFMQYQFAKLNLHGGEEGIYFVEHQRPFFFLFEALLGCTISINFSFLLQRFNAFQFLRVIGFHSLYIYAMQIIVMTASRELLVHIFKITYIPLLFPMIWVLGIFIPILFYNFCMKFNLWWFFTFRKPSKLYRKVAVTSELPVLNTPLSY